MPHVGVDRSDRRHHGRPRRDQTPHGGGEICTAHNITKLAKAI
jgi:hypothetical protein